MIDMLTPLAAMGLERSTLIHDAGLRLHGGVVYPGIRALPAEKSRETPGLPLTYNRDGLPELIYKPDGPLDSRKPTNGYLGLYKGTPPGLHKPVLVPGAGAEGLGLERRVGHGEKASELGLASAGGSYLRLPWLSPYPEASMYPFMDTSKYTALNMYKASLLSQPNPYLPQHLAYSSLCAAQGGNVNPAAAASAAERLYYMPPYPPSPISSPLVAPPMRIPAVTVAPTSLVHCQDKGLGVPPQFAQQLHQPSPHPQHHQAAIDRDRSPSRSSRPSRPPSRKGSSNNNNTSSTSTSGTNGGNNNSLSLDLQRPVARIGQPPTSSTCSVSASSSSTQSIPHPFSVSSMASEQPSPARPSPHKPRPEHRSVGVERRPSRSPSKPNFERPANQPQATKDSAEKPLDLSGRILDFGPPPNGFPVKMDTIASSARYGLPPPSRELLKENLSLSPSSHPHSVVSSTSSKVSERPEMISTLHSSWVVPSPPNTDLGLSQAKGSSPSVIKHKGLERVLPQQRSSSCPRIGEPNHNVPSSQHSGSSLVSSRALSPKPNGEWVKHIPSQSEHPSVAGHHREGTEKSSLTAKRGETTPEVSSYKRPCLENGHPPGHLYLPQNDAYLNHSLAYANRYLHYPIPDGMALHSLPITGKGPVYPHPILLGGNSLYPTQLAAKHPLPYHNLPAGPGGEYLTYNSQEMAHPLMQTHSDNKLPERGDASLKSRGQEKSRGAVEECGGHRDHNVGKEMSEGSQIKPDREAGAQGQGGSQSKAHASSVTSREKIICIDLVHSDTDIESTPTVHKQPSCETSTKPETAFGKPKVPQDTDCPRVTSSTSPRSPGHITQAEESLDEQSPSPDPGDQDQSTLRCARTSGERGSESQGEGDEEEEDGNQTSSKSSRRSSLAKRIANSSGYVGDRFKCVTTELYADSSKLSREQRALQRAMMRFSELELKEKEGGSVCVSASAAGRELADGQRRERALEHCQHTTRQGEREGESASQGGLKDGTKKVLRESEGGHCLPPILTPREEGERVSHPEKRPKISTGENFSYISHTLPYSSNTPPPPPHLLSISVHSLINQQRVRDGLAIPSHPPLPLSSHTISRSLYLSLLSPPAPGVATSPLPPGQLKDRAYPPDPFSGDRGLKEPRRGPPSPAPEQSMGGPPPLKPRRHSDTDKPKGKRPCKTKHTSQREREREKRKEATPNSPGQRCVADLGAAEDDKVSADRVKRAASPNHYPCSPVKPCSPVTLCPPSLQPQVNDRAGGVPPEPVGVHRTPPAEPPTVRPIPPEARRLIVNKNAGETLLQRAARLGYEEVVLYCLENRVCEVNHRDYAGYCALHEACARGWLSIVQHLLDYGADINCSAQDGTRPIHDAVENDHLDVVRVLLSYGADPTLATYSGRGLLKMTHSDSMERFLTDYFADLQGRSDDDQGLYWEFYGSAVCGDEEGGIYDILADPPGPEDEDEDDKREVFEFEFSDRPLLPCYNIQVSLSQGPRNWLLLSDVLRRLRMSARGFRQAFPHMEVVTVAEAEFYQQASLSQLFSCPEELEGFHPDSKELLDLVEDSAELAALLGSTLECLDDRWDHPGDKLKDKIKAVGKLGSS
uniref:BCL6 corepressor n=1 Tax=Seriola lalandi dorsalis TaxID=1841481 RepID=A0A3B4YPV4_SERLL